MHKCWVRVNKVVVVGLLRMKLVAMIVDDVWGTKMVSMKVEDVRWMNVVWLFGGIASSHGTKGDTQESKRSIKFRKGLRRQQRRIRMVSKRVVTGQCYVLYLSCSSWRLSTLGWTVYCNSCHGCSHSQIQFLPTHTSEDGYESIENRGLKKSMHAGTIVSFTMAICLSH